MTPRNTKCHQMTSDDTEGHGLTLTRTVSETKIPKTQKTCGGPQKELPWLATKSMTKIPAVELPAPHRTIGPSTCALVLNPA